MPRYSDDIIEEVRSRSDIVDVIGGYVKLTKKGSNYFGLCPFHNEKTGSFSVSPNKQIYYCFGCGAGGNVFSFLMQYENFTFQEALTTLAERAGVDLPQQEMTSQQKAEADLRTRLLEVNKEAAKYFYTLLRSPRGRRAWEYFHDTRQLTEETMQKFGLGYSDQYSNDLYRYLRKKGYSDQLLKESGLVTIDEARGAHDKFWNRAMFPIMDVHSKVIGFGGRVMGEGEPKYLNSPETRIFDKSRNLYGLHLARSTRKDYFLLCEGYVDVIALHQAGFDNAVASLGTALTAGHANLLSRYTKKVLLTYDSDGAGVKAALRAIPILKEVGISTKVVNMRPSKDPDEFIKTFGAEEYQKRIDQAENSFLFRVRIAERDYDLKDPTSKTAFFNLVGQMLLEFPEELERNNYLEAVASRYQISFDTLRRMVNNMALRGEGTLKPQPEEPREKRKKKEDGMQQSQKLLLTWLVENPAVFPVVRDKITPEDFTEERYRQAAACIYESLQQGRPVIAAQILSQFPEEEDQKELAAIFNAVLPQLTERAEREKALKETILRVKENSIAYRTAHTAPEDLAGLMQLVKDRKTLEKLQTMHFSIE